MNNDLISREALKKAFEDTVCIEPMPYAFVKQIIDNAPTVDTFTFDDMKKGINVGYKAGRLTEKWKRPQGEWIEIPVERDLLYNTGIKYTCSICGKGNCYGKPPFCMYCGADMRGGAE